MSTEIPILPRQRGSADMVASDQAPATSGDNIRQPLTTEPVIGSWRQKTFWSRFCIITGIIVGIAAVIFTLVRTKVISVVQWTLAMISRNQRLKDIMTFQKVIDSFQVVPFGRFLHAYSIRLLYPRTHEVGGLQLQNQSSQLSVSAMMLLHEQQPLEQPDSPAQSEDSFSPETTSSSNCQVFVKTEPGEEPIFIKTEYDDIDTNFNPFSREAAFRIKNREREASKTYSSSGPQLPIKPEPEPFPETIFSDQKYNFFDTEPYLETRDEDFIWKLKNKSCYNGHLHNDPSSLHAHASLLPSSFSPYDIPMKEPYFIPWYMYGDQTKVSSTYEFPEGDQIYDDYPPSQENDGLEFQMYTDAEFEAIFGGRAC